MPESYQPHEFEDLSDLFARHFIQAVIFNLRTASDRTSSDTQGQNLKEGIRLQINILEWVLGIQGQSAILVDLHEYYHSVSDQQKTLD